MKFEITLSQITCGCGYSWETEGHNLRCWNCGLLHKDVSEKKEKVGKKKEKCLLCMVIKPFQFLLRLKDRKS